MHWNQHLPVLKKKRTKKVSTHQFSAVIKKKKGEKKEKEKKLSIQSALTSDEAAQGNIGPRLTVNCSFRHLDLWLKNFKSVKQMYT